LAFANGLIVERIGYNEKDMTIKTGEIHLPSVNDLRDHLLSRLPGIIQRIVMYGSNARGEADSESDVDILIVVDENSPSIVEEARAARYEVMERHEYRPLLSVLLLTDKEWRELSKYSAGLKQNIEREGITLWSRSLIRISQS